MVTAALAEAAAVLSSLLQSIIAAWQRQPDLSHMRQPRTFAWGCRKGRLL